MKTKNIILILTFLLLTFASKAQFTVEATYDSSFGSVYVVNLEQAGQKFIRVMQEPGDRMVYLYNLDYTLWKTIDLNSMPLPYNIGTSSYDYTYSVLYVTQHLFNLDDSVELMFVAGVPSGGLEGSYTTIVNEAGTVLFAANSAGPWIKTNIPQANFPIYNTTAGTKMILSGWNNQAKVYGLPGVLSEVEMPVFGKANNSSLGSFPNPAMEYTNIEYELPEGTNEGEIVFYSMNGSEIKRFGVDRASNSIRISTNHLSAGTYFYQLQTSAGNETKKMVIIK